MISEQIQEIRKFNRFYTQTIGLVDRYFLESKYSITQIRILYEIHQTADCTAKDIRKALQLDEGYLSRIIDGFIKEGVLAKHRSAVDGRYFVINLTEKGLQTFDLLNEQANASVQQLIGHLSSGHVSDLTAAMRKISETLSGTTGSPKLEDIHIRNELRPGDLGYITHLHGSMYFEEHGFSGDFEAYVAEAIATFYRQYDPQKDAVWICEDQGRIIGFLSLYGQGEVAQLRFFLVLPAYRGIGLGKKLMGLYCDFLKERKYQSSFLLTAGVLSPARKLYEKFGFRLVSERKSVGFQIPETEQRYELSVV